MLVDSANIIQVLSEEKELTRLLPLINDVAIIEYDGRSIECSRAIAHYMADNGVGLSVVSRIVLLGKKTSQTVHNESALLKIFPNAQTTVVNKPWYEVEPRELHVWNTLTFHVGVTVGMNDYMFDKKQKKGECFVNFVNKTRVAYYVCLLNNRQTSLFDCAYTSRLNLRLRSFALDTGSSNNEKTQLCKDKQDYINSCLKTLSAKDTFFQLIDEAEHGCEKCNQCGNYGYHKRCPFAQRMIAKHYREGIYVPQNDRIAHQWEVMAARQDYKPSKIQIADDLKEGYGCKKDTETALGIYYTYASQKGNEHCIDQILHIAEDDAHISPIVAIPFIAQQAQDGSEDMIMKLSDAFQNATFGLPKDMTQQREWIQQGAENGNPRFVLAMAEMYE